MNWKNWFKCNTIRYFALNVECRDNHKNWCTRCLDNNTNINDPSQSSISSCTIGSRWNYSTNSRMGKKFVRYSENDNGIHTWKSYAGGRAPFFIARVENHYHNEIDNDVYSPLVALGNDEPGYDFPVWRRRLGIPNPIDESFLTPTAFNHLTLDSPELLAEIREYQKRYNQYSMNIESLPRIIDSIVKSKFIERGIYPTPSDHATSFW